MKLLDLILQCIDYLTEFKDAIMGSLIYSFYAHIFQNKPILKNISSFFIGVIFSTYLSDPVHVRYPDLKLGFISFVMGLLGMKLVEILLDTNWKGVVIKKLNK